MFVKRQSGSVLMMVLLIVVSMIALITFMTLTSKVTLQRTKAIALRQQMVLSARSANNLVITLLQRTMRNQPLTSLDQPWALTGASFPIDSATLTGSVTDMRSCYNINVLYAMKEDAQGVWPEQVNILMRLIMSQDIPEHQARTLTAKMWDYIDPDQLTHRGGGEDLLYRTHSPPTLTAGQMLIDISELRVVNGISPEIYKKITPYLCALPEATLKINVNTLTEQHAPLLQAILNREINSKEMGYWLANRPLGGWKEAQIALETSERGLSNDDIARLVAFFGVKSDYFRFDGTLQEEDTMYKWFTLIQRKKQTMNIIVQMQNR